MTNEIIVILETDNNGLKIKVNGKTKIKINVNNKVISTKEIYDILKYNIENKYTLNCERLKEKDTKGKDNEINRLYNYVYDLFNSIIDAINDINKK